MEQAPSNQRQSFRMKEGLGRALLLLPGAAMALILAPRGIESFWPNFLFYWLTQALPLVGMMLLGSRLALLGGSATALFCFLLLCWQVIDQSVAWLFYVFGVYGATIIALVASDSCRVPRSAPATAYAVGFSAVLAGTLLPLIKLVLG
ncbi:hypothetical protein [Trinickia sp.]|uniref:hypothetical protein n=1 Tax=Trinickia sp. TaxID=2571163 RepID=UPI003F7D0AFE